MSAGASKELSSFFLFGKNLRLVGASVKDCVLLYKRTEGEVMMFMVMVMVMMLVVMVMMAMVMMMLKVVVVMIMKMIFPVTMPRWRW